MVAGATYIDLVDGGYEVQEALYRVLLADVESHLDQRIRAERTTE